MQLRRSPDRYEWTTLHGDEFFKPLRKVLPYVLTMTLLSLWAVVKIGAWGEQACLHRQGQIGLIVGLLYGAASLASYLWDVAEETAYRMDRRTFVFEISFVHRRWRALSYREEFPTGSIEEIIVKTEPGWDSGPDQHVIYARLSSELQRLDPLCYPENFEELRECLRVMRETGSSSRDSMPPGQPKPIVTRGMRSPPRRLLTRTLQFGGCGLAVILFGAMLINIDSLWSPGDEECQGGVWHALDPIGGQSHSAR